MPAASTTTLSVQVLDFEDMRLLIQRGRLYAISVRQASVLPAASFRSCFAAGTLAVRLTVPLAGSVRDFHSQVSAPCRAHTKKMGVWRNLHTPLHPNKHCDLYAATEVALMLITSAQSFATAPSRVPLIWK